MNAKSAESSTFAAFAIAARRLIDENRVPQQIEHENDHGYLVPEFMISDAAIEEFAEMARRHANGEMFA